MFENRVEYKGEFKNNLYNGEREYKWSIGRSYKGNLRMDLWMEKEYIDGKLLLFILLII